MEWLQNSNDLIRNLISSLILVIGILTLRILSIRGVRKAKVHHPEIRRRWIVQIKNSSILLIAIGFFLIWATELKTFAVSVVAIAAALVIATKELILCFLGGLMKTGTQLFTVGDRIEIAGLRGDVTDHSLLTTTLYEIGPGKEFHQFTGRVIIIPNAMILSHPIINETETGSYVLHVFRVPISVHNDLQACYDRLLAAANTSCHPFLEDARRQFLRLGRREGIEAPNVAPRISLAYPDEKRIDLVLRIVAPSRRKGRIEQEILARYAGLDEKNVVGNTEPPLVP